MAVFVAVAKIGELLAAVGAINDIVELIIKLVDNSAVKSALGLAQAGANTVKTGIDFARQRTDQKFNAVGMGTTSRQMDVLARTYEGVGMSAEEAANDFAKFASAMDEAFSKTGEGLPSLEKLGVQSVDGKGNRLDTGVVYENALRALADRSKNIQDRKDNPGDIEKFRADQMSLNGIYRDLFKDNYKAIGAFKSVGGGHNLDRLIKEGLARRPPIDDKTDENYRSAVLKDIENGQLGGRIAEAKNQNLLARLLDTLAKTQVDLAGRIRIGKSDGSISMTEEELAPNRIRMAAQAILDENRLKDMDPFEVARFHSAVSVLDMAKKRRISAEYSSAPKELIDQFREDEGRAEEALSRLIDPNAIKAISNLSTSGIAAAGNPFGKLDMPGVREAVTNIFGPLKPPIRSNLSDFFAPKAGLDAFRAFGATGAVSYPPASNTTTITIGVTAGAGATEIASAVAGAVRTAVAMAKGTNGWTQGSALA